MSLTLSQQYLTEHTEPTEKDNLMNPLSSELFTYLWMFRSLLAHACPVQFFAEDERSEFNRGGPISQLPEWYKERYRTSNKFWPKWCRRKKEV